jgi:hypothetical protein
MNMSISPVKYVHNRYHQTIDLVIKQFPSHQEIEGSAYKSGLKTRLGVDLDAYESHMSAPKCNQ